jgi:hypothetical protein
MEAEQRMQRRYKLDKIVIRTDSNESVRSMVSCLRTLFPECEIIVQPGNGEIGEDVQKASELPAASLLTEKIIC